MFEMTSRLTKRMITTVAFAACIAVLSLSSLAQTVKRSWADGTPNATMQNATKPATSAKGGPTLIRNIENPDRQTILSNFWTELFGLGDGGAGCGSGFNYPAGTRIYIKSISIKLVSPTPVQGPYVAVYTSKTGSSDESLASAINIGLQAQGVHYPSDYHYTALQPVDLVVEMDDWLCESVYVGSSHVPGKAHISYFGYVLPPL